MLIGELAAHSGISARMLRHYDRIGLVSPTERSPNGYREYSARDLRRLFQVEGLRSLGLSLREIDGVLADLSFSPAGLVEQLIARTRDQVAREQELLRRLEQVRASEPADWSDALRTIALLRGLDAGDPSARQRFVLSHAAETDQDAETLAEAALNEADPNVAGALHWALARTGDRAVPVLARGLESTVAERRRRAVMALAKLPSPHATAALAAAFRHPDPFVRGRAALARGRLGEPDAVPALVELVVSGEDDVEATDVLGRLARDPAHEDGIVRALALELSGAGEDARQRLALVLAELPGEPADALLRSLSGDPSPAVALTASFLLRGRPDGERSRE